VSQSETISANIDLIAKLRRQLEERDAEIASLKVSTRLLSGHPHCKCKAHMCSLHCQGFAALGGNPESVLLILQLQQAGAPALTSMENDVSSMEKLEVSDCACT